MTPKAERYLPIIEREAERILAVRKLTKFIIDEPLGTGVVLENPGRASLRMCIDWRDSVVEVSFFSPLHLNAERTFVSWPHCDDPFHRFGLWEVLRAKRIPYGAVIGELTELSVQHFLSKAVDHLLESCLPILDGDLSIVQEIAYNRNPSLHKL
ncbi:MAG: hypothetical protein ABL962_18140 [Fimbriimonadaceae bacterium]